jgi:hypothetical protein
MVIEKEGRNERTKEGMKEGRLVELLHSTKQQQQKKTTVNMKRLGYKYTLPFPKYVCIQMYAARSSSYTSTKTIIKINLVQKLI